MSRRTARKPVQARAFYTTEQAADILHVSVSTMRRWRSTGEGPAFVRFGARSIRYQSADLLRWMKANRNA